MIDSDKYSISPSLCGFGVQHCDWRQIGFSALLLSIKYNISYWKKNESVQTPCPQRCRWTDCLIQCGCLTKDAHMGALVDLHHKNTWQKKKEAKFVCGVSAKKQVWVKKDWLTLGISHPQTHTRPTHFHASWICMLAGPQSRGDNKSHFRHVCQVSRQHLSPGWMWWVGSE